MNLLRNSTAIVRDLQDNHLPVCLSANLDSTTYPSSGLDRLLCVEQKVQDHLVDLGRGADDSRYLTEILDYLDLVPFQPAPDQLQAAGDRRMQVHSVDGSRVRAGQTRVGSARCRTHA